jgi:cytochrome c
LNGRRDRFGSGWRGAVTILWIVCCAAGCSGESAQKAVAELGDVRRGRELMIQRQCYDCHIIPGVPGKPGPGVPTSLAGFAKKKRFALGTVENTRANLEAYLQHPRKVFPRTAQPGIGDRPDEARDIAAYLMTLD